MFDSNISASAIIAQVKDEADIALPISDAVYIQWINSAEQLLYTELIREQRSVVLESPDACVSLAELDAGSGESPIRFEDIHAVYADKAQLILTTQASAEIFKQAYFKKDEKLALSLSKPCRELRIVYYVRPALKTEENAGRTNIMLPLEFIDLIKARLRGEAYKLANEDALAAKWLNDYNVLLNHFEAWLNAKRPSFGL